MKKIKVFITIDTEEDLWDKYKQKDNPVENIDRIPSLQALFDKYNAIPTYCINYPVVTNEKSVKILRDIYKEKKCHIAMHCHPWNTPPFNSGKIGDSMLFRLPDDLLFNKLQTMDNEIKTKFNLKADCFRAGRWGFDSKVAKAIVALNYKIDTSITPFIDWSCYGGKNFFNAKPGIYRIDLNDPLKQDNNSTLIEITPTIGFLRQNFSFQAQLRKWLLNKTFSKLHLIGILERLKIINLRWLCPEQASANEMIALSKRMIKNGTRYLNMVFHSTSLLPGAGPFVKDESNLINFFNKIELFLKFIVKNNHEFSPLTHQAILELDYGKRDNDS